MARRQPAALGDVELQGDQVEAGRALGDRVLDLQPGVHLQEVEAAVVGGEELDRAGAAVADRPRGGDGGGEQRSRIAGAARRAATAPPRRPSGGGAGSSTRARRAPRRCRARRPGPAPRRGVRSRGTARRTRSGRRTRRPPRPRRGDLAVEGTSSVRTTRMPRPPPPADALISTGRSAVGDRRRAASSASTGTPAAAISRLASIFEPIASIGRRRRADPGQPGVDDGAGEVGVLGQEAVAGVDGVGAGRRAARR